MKQNTHLVVFLAIFIGDGWRYAKRNLGLKALVFISVSLMLDHRSSPAPLYSASYCEIVFSCIVAHDCQKNVCKNFSN